MLEGVKRRRSFPEVFKREAVAAIVAATRSRRWPRSWACRPPCPLLATLGRWATC
jgi:hypothetical protein